MRMKTLAFALAACCATALPARAEMETAFGNTVVSHYPDGAWVNGQTLRANGGMV